MLCWSAEFAKLQVACYAMKIPSHFSNDAIKIRADFAVPELVNPQYVNAPQEIR